jgi:hypothetical protein
MDIQDYLTAITSSERAKRMAQSDQLTLGELILKMEAVVARQKARIAEGKEEATVGYDFEYLFPTSIDSWRRSYAELALNFQAEGNELTATDFLKVLKDAVGKTFCGYKGGDYVMSRQTPVWVANYGNSGNTAVLDVIDDEYQVVIVTGYRQF